MCYESHLAVNSEIKIQAGLPLIGPAVYLWPALFSLVNLTVVPSSCNSQAASESELVSCKTWSWQQVSKCFVRQCQWSVKTGQSTMYVLRCNPSTRENHSLIELEVSLNQINHWPGPWMLPLYSGMKFFGLMNYPSLLGNPWVLPAFSWSSFHLLYLHFQRNSLENEVVPFSCGKLRRVFRTSASRI